MRPSPAPEAALSPLQPARREPEIGRAGEVKKGHGRIEERSIEVISSMSHYLGSNRPGYEQVFRLKRVRKTGEKIETQVVMELTRLPCERAGARRLLALTRGHWGIEYGPSRRSQRDDPRGRQPDQKGAGVAGDRDREEHGHLRLQAEGLTPIPRRPRDTTSTTPGRPWKSCQPQDENETAPPAEPRRVDDAR